MLFYTVLIVPVLSALAADEHTYRRTDPVTGQTLMCDRCPPGSRLRAHCTRSRQTECAPCGAGLFTEFWNYIPDCLLCDACSDHQRVLHPCNGTVNTVCECEPGFYWDQHFCKRHSRCRAGHGVRAAGTPHRDTVCELCADGWFASITRPDAPCVPHSACASGHRLLLRGSGWHDSVCATCLQLAERGWAALLKPVLSGLQVQYRTSILRLECLVNRRLHKKLCERGALQPGGDLDLPLALEDAQLAVLAGRLSHRIRRFQKLCRTTTAVTA